MTPSSRAPRGKRAATGTNAPRRRAPAPAGKTARAEARDRAASRPSRAKPPRAAAPRAANGDPAPVAPPSERHLLPTVLEATDALISVVDREGRVISFNRACEKLSGYSFEEIRGRVFYDIFLPPDEAEQVRAVFARLGEQEPILRHENHWITKSGERRRIVWSNAIVRDSGGEIRHLVGTGIDVTELRRADALRREAEADYRKLFDHASDGIVILARGGRFLDLNVAACRTMGYSREELIGRPVQEVLDPEDLARQPLRAGVVHAGQTVRLVRRVRRKDGSLFYAETSTTALADGRVIAILRDISERENAEQALRESEARSRALTEQASDGIWTMDADTRVVQVNARLCEMTGYAREEVVGHLVAEYLLPEELAVRPLSPPELGRTVLTERSIRCKDGSILEAEISTRRITEDSFVGIVRDVAERKRAERALRESEARYRALMDQASDGIWLTDGETRLLEANARLCEMTGYPREEIVGRFVSEFLLPEELAAHPLRTREVGLGRTVLSERRIRCKDGSLLETEISTRGLAPDLSIGVVRDVSERKRAERALRASEERFRRLVESDMIGIFFAQTDGRVQDANDYFLRVTGYDRRDLLAGCVRWDRMVAAEDARRNAAVIEEGLARGSFPPIERELLRKDGTRIVVLIGGTRIEAEGAPFVCFLLDLTVLRRAEENLAEAQRYLSRAQELAHVGSWEANLETMIARFSDEMLRICGLPEDTGDISYDEFLALVHPEDRAMVDARIHSQIERAAAEYFENRLLRPDGGIRIVEAISEPVYDASGRMVRLIGSVQDITERRFLERQLREAQKLEAIGRLAGGVAHDFNNLLTLILGYAETLLAGLEPLGPRHDSADQIRQAGRRAAALTQQLLAFARRQVFELQVFDLNTVIVGMREILERLLGERIEVAITPGGAPCVVRVDRGQIEQVILNLALNARDAMPDGGRLSIATYALRAGPRGGPGGDQDGVRLTVSDTGAGMSAEVQSHIFEPFFTTKQAGRGTGLGLATVHGIVAQSGGRIEVISAPGQGSTFHVYLPAADAGESPRESPPPACGRGGNETILLVEDETSVRELAACVLREHGYRVIEAGNAERALEAAASLAGPLDLLLTDIVMPGLNGRELAERLGRDRAGLRVLFVSGYSDEALAHQDAACRSGAFLEKPFGPEALLGKVREVLEPSRPGPSGR